MGPKGPKYGLGGLGPKYGESYLGPKEALLLIRVLVSGYLYIFKL